MRVAVFGSSGRMGQMVCAAVDAEADLDVVARVDVHDGEPRDAVAPSGAEVMVDFTHPEQVLGNVEHCVAIGVHCVVGTSGFGPDKLDAVRAMVAGGKANVFVAPNFSIGAVLMMQFARQAARFMGSCEIVELHHNQKLDAPSGTGEATARLVAGAWAEHGRPLGGEPASGEFESVPGARGATVDGVHVHSVRLRGLLAHQEVVLGSTGETLSIRHDTMERSSFMPGVVLAVRAVASRPGLTVGLEHLLGLA